jgi:hypothetical protein
LIDFGLLVLEKKILKKFQCIFTLSLLSPLGIDYPLPLNKFESPSPKDNLCQVWLELALWFWRRRFLNDHISFLRFCNYLPFEEDLALYLNKLRFPSSKDSLYQV